MASSSILAVACVLLGLAQLSIGLSIANIINGAGNGLGNTKCTSGNGYNSQVCTNACACIQTSPGLLGILGVSQGCLDCCNAIVGGLDACTLLADNDAMIALGGPVTCTGGSVTMDQIKGPICDCCYGSTAGQDKCTSVGVPNNQFWTEFKATCGGL